MDATWHTNRRTVLGSSECWQIFIPWLSAKGLETVDMGFGRADVAMPLKDAGPSKVWNAKTGPQEPDPTDPDDPRVLGHEGEDFVARLAYRKLATTGDSLDWQRHTSIPWMGATGDRMLATGEGLECKLVTFDHNRIVWHGDAAPLFVQLQALWCCEVYDVETWHIAAYVGSRGHVLYPPVVRSVARKWLDGMITVCGKWWDEHITRGTMPEIDGTLSCYQVIKRQYATHGSDIRKADADDIAAIEAWRAADKARSAADLELQAAKNRVCRLIGDDAGIYVDGLGRATWKADTSGNRILRWSAR